MLVTYRKESDNEIMVLFRKKKPEVKTYDSTHLIPAIRSSICTGEKVAGFKNKETGEFTEIALILSDKDLEAFKSSYDIKTDIETFY